MSEAALDEPPLTAQPGLPSDWPGVEIFDRRQQLGDVVAVAAGQTDRERDATRVDPQMML